MCMHVATSTTIILIHDIYMRICIVEHVHVVHVLVPLFVGCCLATEVFVARQIAGFQRGVGDHRVGQ